MKFSICMLACAAALSAAAGDADVKASAKSLFGDGVFVFSPEDSAAEIDLVVEGVFKKQHHRQFGEERYAFLFLPGDYTKTKAINVGYYTQLLGLGRLPMDVKLTNVKTPAALDENNATCNFWVGIENVSIVDPDGNVDPFFGFQWAVSQAAPARRLHVVRKSFFDWFYGWASGGFVADCVFEKGAGSYSQQQYFYRNNAFGEELFGINWNQVVVGCSGDFASKSKDNSGTPLSRCETVSGGNADAAPDFYKRK